MKWTCGECGAKIETQTVDDHQRINHLTQHNPTPAQWTEAYNRIQDGREKAKKTAAKAE